MSKRLNSLLEPSDAKDALLQITQYNRTLTASDKEARLGKSHNQMKPFSNPTSISPNNYRQADQKRNQ